LNPAFKFVGDAAQITASGRRDVVNDAIVRLAKNPGPNNAWYVQVLGALCSKIFSEYQLLKNAYAEPQRDDAPLLAWRARNLLELSVWSMFCTKNRENARQLYEDAGRDVGNIYVTFQNWGKATAQDANFLEPLANAEHELSERAASEGIETLDGSYKKVHEAAKECGRELEFKTGFKFLSKFAHPTAMQVLAPPDESKTLMQRDCFFSLGCLYFSGAFFALEKCLLSFAGERGLLEVRQ
jgi:hypothetical protein